MYELNAHQVNDKLEKATVYRIGEFLGDVIKEEVHLSEYGNTSFAQYRSVPFYVAKRKRARKALKWVVSGYKPNLLIVKGWGRPEPASVKKVLRRDENVVLSTYTCSISNPQSLNCVLSDINEKDILFKEIND